MVDARDGKGCTPLFRAADEVTAAAAEAPSPLSAPRTQQHPEHDGPSLKRRRASVAPFRVRIMWFRVRIVWLSTDNDVC